MTADYSNIVDKFSPLQLCHVAKMKQVVIKILCPSSLAYAFSLILSAITPNQRPVTLFAPSRADTLLIRCFPYDIRPAPGLLGQKE